MPTTSALSALACAAMGTASLSLPDAPSTPDAEAGLPNLRVFGSLEDSIAAPGDRITLDYTAFNDSSTDYEDIVVGFYLSTDASYGGGDTFLESEEINVDGGESESDNEQVGLPTGLVSGNYFVLVFLDSPNVIAESDETDNVAALPISITGNGGPAATWSIRQPCQGTVIADGLTSFASTPELGDDFVVEIDDPTNSAGLPADSMTLWIIGGIRPASYPCGAVLPGFGPNGTDGEVLFGSSPAVVLVEPINLFDWGGPGDAALHEVIVPANPSLAGVEFYSQGLFFAPDGTVALTNALDFVVGT